MENPSDQITESKEYSSLPLVLTISGVFLLSAAGGWLLLDRDTTEPIADDAITPAILTEDAGNDTAPIDIGSELRKARLAADADFLASPPEQSALYFYGRVIEADPNHPVANAELDAVLTRISLVVRSQLAAGKFDDAYTLAVLVAKQKPDHALITEMRQTLNDYADQLVKQATEHVKDGNDDDAEAVLAIAEGLPGLNSEYFSAVRDSISRMQESRAVAERDKLEEARLAATIEWADKVRSAIDSGRLIAPAEESAQHYLAQQDAPAEAKEELTNELVAALITAGQDSTDSGDLADAELYLDAVNDLDEDFDGLVELRDKLENKLIEAEGKKVMGLSSFTRVNSVSPRYPARADRRNISGWVEVVFTVTSSGSTADIEVLRAEPENMFESSAIEAVKKWTFQPREFRGQAIDQRTAARMVYELE